MHAHAQDRPYIIARPGHENYASFAVVDEWGKPDSMGQCALTELATINHCTSLYRRNPEGPNWETQVTWPSWGERSIKDAHTFGRAIMIAATLAAHIDRCAALGEAARAQTIALLQRVYAPPMIEE